MELDFIDLIISIISTLIIRSVYKEYVAPHHNKYLTFWPRFWAPTVDELVLWIPVSLIPYLIYQMFELGLKASNLLFVSECLIYYLYSIFFHGTFGATIGKMATKVKVVDAATEGPITFKQAIIRDLIPFGLSIILIVYIFATGEDVSEGTSSYLSHITLIIGLWFLIEIVTMLTNKKRRALHDYIAGTVVIRTEIEGQYF